MNLLKLPVGALFGILAMVGPALGAAPDTKTLPRGLAPWEKPVTLSSFRDRPSPTNPPVGPVHGLGEWEESSAVMTGWPNASWVRALAERGQVKLFADSETEVSWWKNWLQGKGIPQSNISYFVVPTDSFWVRDYGPWFLVDGNGQFGMVDTIYNRPRPNDDKVPAFLSRELGIPLYAPALVHTGGNFYNDGVGNAFSSTLVYSENSSLPPSEINSRMKNFLGIDPYTTGRLNPGLTIEHIDTYGKLVAPDTWVWGQFPNTSKYYADSEAYVAKLKAMTSPYGTPYKIFRLPMVSSIGDTGYRAYINAFISNGVLYFPTYGAASDETARKTYAQALPGYEIVGVDSDGTEWGDSVHCRSRNLMTDQAVSIFPRVTNLPVADGQNAVIQAAVIPGKGASLVGNPVVHYRVTLNSSVLAESDVDMAPVAGKFSYEARLPGFPVGAKFKLWIEAKDSLGHTKRAPRGQQQAIEF